MNNDSELLEALMSKLDNADWHRCGGWKELSNWYANWKRRNGFPRSAASPAPEAAPVELLDEYDPDVVQEDEVDEGGGEDV